MTVLGKSGSWVIVQPGHPVKVSLKQIALTVSAERGRMAAGNERERETERGVDVVKGTEREADKSVRAKSEEIAHGQIHASLRLPDKASKLGGNV